MDGALPLLGPCDGRMGRGCIETSKWRSVTGRRVCGTEAAQARCGWAGLEAQRGLPLCAPSLSVRMVRRKGISHLVSPSTASGAGIASVASMCHRMATAPPACMVKVACSQRCIRP